ncbi:malate synthase A [Deinococcus altitudinis]|uniref:malate synthase A n=1 Tax=Deinococcus altitudinis TaxID=468914 RepID=UPI0038921962
MRTPSEVLRLADHLHTELLADWWALELPARWEPGRATPETGGDWRAASIPATLHARRAELIVAASDGEAVRHGLEAGADAVVLDLDDVFSPRRGNLERAYANFVTFAATEHPFLTRLRPLAHREGRVTFGGQQAVAGMLDLAAYAHAFRAREIVAYLPKLDTVQEALFWKRALELTERWLGLPMYSVRVCLQIETLPGLMNAEALLHALRGYAYGLNAGRWDYVFSVVKHLGERPDYLLPERARLTMNEPSMLAYALHIVSVCRDHGAQAIGGTAAVALSGEPRRDGPALEGVRHDKAREAAQGFVAAWAGSPALLEAVRGAFGAAPALPDADQLVAGHPLADHLGAALALPRAEGIPDSAVQDAIGVALAVFAAWLVGVGDVARAGRSEDTATAELARAQLWHWRRRGLLSGADYLRWRRDVSPDGAQTAQLLDALVLAEVCAPYFPGVAEAMFPEAAFPAVLSPETAPPPTAGTIDP